MHLDVLREVPGEDLGDEEAVVEGAAHILNRVAEIERLDPFEDFARKASRSGVLRCH